MGCHGITMDHHGIVMVCHGSSIATHGIAMDCRANAMPCHVRVMAMASPAMATPWAVMAMPWWPMVTPWPPNATPCIHHGNAIAALASAMALSWLTMGLPRNCHGNLELPQLGFAYCSRLSRPNPRGISKSFRHQGKQTKRTSYSHNHALTSAGRTPLLMYSLEWQSGSITAVPLVYRALLVTSPATQTIFGGRYHARQHDRRGEAAGQEAEDSRAVTAGMGDTHFELAGMCAEHKSRTRTHIGCAHRLVQFSPPQNAVRLQCQLRVWELYTELWHRCSISPCRAVI